MKGPEIAKRGVPRDHWGSFWSYFPGKSKFDFSTVCRRLVRGIKEGWSVIDIVRLNFWVSRFFTLGNRSPFQSVNLSKSREIQIGPMS